MKFKQLWKSGLDAHLDLNTSAGKAWVGLRLQLGDAQHTQHQDGYNQHRQKSRDSPAKERRRNKRASLRELKSNEDLASASEEEESRDNDNLESIEEIVEDVSINEKVTEEEKGEEIVEHKETVEEAVHENVTEDITEEVSNGDKDMHNQFDEEVVEKVDLPLVNEVEKVVEQPANKKVLEEPTSGEEILQEVSDEGKVFTKNVASETVVVVYATAVLENCPDGKVTRNHLDSLSNIIDSKDHLQRNIEDFKFGNISTWEYGVNKFKHQIGVILDVKTAQLWESARGYLFEHLGTSTWTLNDGTEVNLIRIHQR